MRTVGALCGAMVLWLLAAPLAHAAGRPYSYDPEGTLDYVWTGDSARGCAAAGVCGVVGSLQVQIYGNGIYEVDNGGPIELSDPNAVARVTYPSDDGGPAQTCIEPEPYDVIFSLQPSHGVPTEAVARSGEPIGGDPSAGDCAGPTVTQLKGVRLPVHAMGRRGYSLAGTDSFGAGPFEVTVTSTMRALTERGGGSSRSSSGPPSKPFLVEFVELDYRLTQLHGAFSIPFTGAQAPACVPFAACGASGKLSVALTAPRQTYRFEGLQAVRHRVSPAAALSAFRSGKLEGLGDFGDLAIRGVVTGAFAAPGEQACVSTTRSPFDDFSSIFFRRSVRFSFDEGATGGVVLGLADPLRTDCPGPSSTEVLGSGALATGSVPRPDLGAKTLTVNLAGSHAFAATAYTGQRRGSMSFTLVRTRERAGTTTARGYNEAGP